MLRNPVYFAVFLAGLAVVCWIGAGYAGSNPLGLVVAGLIGACYVAGGIELYRYHQATATLQQALTHLSAAPDNLGDWLGQLHRSLRHATRLRIEGERAALPAAALTPYLVGLLVLLGMLGTLLGMMATLRGTGLALESATDLEAMRSSLAAPVKGLGFAFGTSIAGVATSAMLGLLSALCRRERMQVSQWLDAKVATTLRVFSPAHQREETFKLLQRQADQMPTLVDRLQAMMLAIEQQNQTTSEHQLVSQSSFHSRTEATYTRLASSMEESLKACVAETALAAGAALQPAVEATMTGLTRQTASLHDTVTQAVQQQLAGLSTRFETSTAHVADIWNRALAEHRLANQAQAQDLRGTMNHFTESFEQRSAGLLEGVFARLDATASDVADAWNQTLARQESVNEKLVARNDQALSAASASLEQRAASLVASMDQSHADLQATLAAHDQQRLDIWANTLDTASAALNEHWRQAGERFANHQQEIGTVLASTASEITAQTQMQASATIAEISQLVQAASEAPRAAAEVVAELRQKLSDSMVRDTAMLEERTRLMATLETLLQAVNHASVEQRSAIDALVSTSSDLLERAGTHLTAHIETQTGKLDTAAAQVTAGAAEVASLGEAFSAAVQTFGKSNDKLLAKLQRVEGALDKSLTRSDEQLAYYVAQAREVVDLSVLSQKQIIEDLQQLADRTASVGEDAA